jgi:Tol biopolymer transport system component
VFSAENMRVIVTSISPDGLHALADVDAGSGRGGDIWVVPLVEDAEPVAFLDSPFIEFDGRFSPDGRFVAYSSIQSGRVEVYVRPYPPASGQWQVSTNGGTEPQWSDDGRELYYLTLEQELVVVPLSTTPTFEPGVPQTLFELRVGSRSRHNYDVVGSQRFLVSVQDDEDLVPTTITLNWPALLDR